MFRLILKSGEITQVLVFLAVLAIFWIPSFANPGVPSHLPLDGPLYTWMTQLINSVPMLALFIELGFIIAIALLLNLILLSNDLIQRKNFLPAIFIVLLLSWNNNLQALNPVVPALLFIIISIFYLLSAYNQQAPYKQLFTAGIMVGIASMFYLPFMVLLLGLFFSMLTLRINSLREWLIPVIAFLLPGIYWISIAYLFDTPFPLVLVFRKTGIQMMFLNEVGNTTIFWIVSCWLFLLYSLFSTLNQLNARLISIRRKTYIIVDFLLVAVLILLSSGHVFLYVNMLIILFLCAFLAMYFDGSKRTTILDLIFSIFTVSLIVLRFFKS